MPFITWQDKLHKITIYYEVVGKGAPLVLHHGNGNCIKDWYTLGYVDQLANDFQLILIDSRGYGKSSKPHDVAAYHLHSRACDTIAVLDAINIEKADFLGASISASLCFLLARYFPERFSSYIFATPYFSLFDETIKAALLQGNEAFVKKLEELIDAPINNEAIRATFLANDPKALWAANSSEWFNYRDYIQYIQAPSLIYVGSLEPSLRELTELAAQLPNNRLQILPGVDHKDAYWNSRLVVPVIHDFLVTLSLYR